MDQQLAFEILAGDSDELAELKANFAILEGFVDLVQKLDGMPDINKRFWENSRSLYQATSKDRDIATLETVLSDFFGPPTKAADKALPRKLSKESTVKHLGGIHKEQSLFLLHLKTGTFYGALWPWRRNKNKIEIHLGYCSDWMVDEDYRKLENLIKRSISQNTLSQMDAQIGGQIRGISLPSFLQMSEMEQSTFTLVVSSGRKLGHLHIVGGKLLDAQTDQWQGRDAAYRVISWDDATIEITPIAENVSDEIGQPLMHVLMESLKIKDEIVRSDSVANMPPPPPVSQPPGQRKTGTQKPLVRLERIPPPPKPSRQASKWLTIAAIVLGTLLVVAGGGLFGLKYFQKRTGNAEFRGLAEQLEATKDEARIVMLIEQFLKNHPDSPHIAELNDRLETARNRVEDSDFEATTLKISSLPIDELYEQKAISLYSDFLEKYPNSRHSDQINKSIKEIKNLIDQYFYDELKRAARLDLNKRLTVYRDYVKRFPNGRYHEDVVLLINEMGNEYLDYLKAQDGQCVENQRFEPCIQRYDEFITSFRYTPLAGKAEALESQLIDQRDLAQLKRKVVEAGNDYITAARLYKDYLTRHPNSSQKTVIEQELARLEKNMALQRQWLAVRKYAADPAKSLFDRMKYVDEFLRSNLSGPYSQQAQELLSRLDNERRATEQERTRQERQLEEQARIRKERELAAQRKERIARISAQINALLADSSRYHVNGDGTVTDTATGTMWSLLDSYQELNGCIDYKTALAYVKSLRNGGYGDWRLPTANELAALYKKPPFFPASGAQWYWTSEAYVKGFHSVVDVVTTKPVTVFERENRTEDQCGAVRAVRP